MLARILSCRPEPSSSGGKGKSMTFPSTRRRRPDGAALVIDEVNVVDAQGLIAAVGKAERDAHFARVEGPGGLKEWARHRTGEKQGEEGRELRKTRAHEEVSAPGRTE